MKLNLFAKIVAVILVVLTLSFMTLYVILYIDRERHTYTEEEFIQLAKDAGVDTSDIIEMNPDGSIKYKPGQLRDSLVCSDETINGSSCTRYKQDSSRHFYKAFVFKKKYWKEKYFVYIGNDTLTVGDSLKFKAVINSNLVKHARVLLSGQESSTIRDSVVYSIKANQPGIFDLTGEIELDEEKIPFEFKYCVEEKRDL